jgi:hypothetical protein
MLMVITLATALVLSLLVSSAFAQDADALRRELDDMRRGFEAMRQQYERSMQEMAERIKRLETQPAPTAPTAPTAQTAPSTPSVLDLARPRQPFALAAARGPGTFLFDIGVAGDFVANLTSRKVDKADAGTFRDRENRFFPREIEVALFGQVDPYARAEVRIEAGEESPGGETEVSLAEAHLTLLTLPFNTQLKLGQMRNRYGWSNQFHAHDLPWVDRPNVHRAFFGEEALVEKGLELTWVPDLPFFLEVLAGVFNGDNEDAFGRGKITNPAVSGRIRAFFEPAPEHGLQLGASIISGVDGARLSNTLPAVDVRYKYRPEGSTHPLLTLGAEAVWALRTVETVREFVIPGELVDTDGDGIPDTPLPDEVGIAGEKRKRTRFGGYAYAELQPFRRWAGGLRADYVEAYQAGREWALEPYVTFWPSEFLRFRLAYKRTERHGNLGFFPGGSSVRHIDEVFFQGTFLLGAHPAHAF